jgi:hypothetical protein
VVAVDRQRFDADPEPDPVFYFNAYPDLDPTLKPRQVNN